MSITPKEKQTVIFALEMLHSTRETDVVQRKIDNAGVTLLSQNEIRDLLRELRSDRTDYDGTQCPNCGSANIAGEDFDPVSAESALRQCNCNDCRAQWVEQYEVTKYDNLEFPDEEDT